jgi:hypothetical protein
MRKFIAPPYFQNGNPLNAYGVNQIIEATNALESEFLDFKMLRPKMLIKKQMKAIDSETESKNGFVLLKNFSHLRVAGNSTDGNVIQVYLKRVGKNDVKIGEAITASSSFDIYIHLNNLNENTPNAGEIYIIYLTSSSLSADTTVNYMYEYNLAAITKIAMPTINGETIIDQAYLNKFVDNIRQLPDLAPSNPPFRGVGGRVSWPGGTDNYINQFAKWEGVRLNNFLRMRFRTQRGTENLSVYFFIETNEGQFSIGSFFAGSLNSYDYVLDFTTREWTITNAITGSQVSTGTAENGVQNIAKGTFYQFKTTAETNTTSSYFYVDYVLESKNPL